MENGASLTMYKGYTQYMPIWDNPGLPELNKSEGFDLWKKAGVRFLYQLYHKHIILLLTG